MFGPGWSRRFRGAPGGVVSEVASVCQWLERPRLGVVAEGSSVVRGVGSTLLWWCFQLVGKGMLVWCVEVARSKGKLGRGGRGPPPFLHADLRWRVKPAECAQSQKTRKDTDTSTRQLECARTGVKQNLSFFFLSWRVFSWNCGHGAWTTHVVRSGFSVVILCDPWPRPVTTILREDSPRAK